MREQVADADVLSAPQESSRELARDFEFRRRDFERVRKLIYARAGINLSDSKEDMVYNRLSRRLRELGIPAFQTYLDQLESAGDENEWQAFTNCLTTNLTSFFREPHHFDVLKQHLRQLAKQPGLTIWCAAASTGEEPYSIAITAAEAFGTLFPPVRILATDIDTRVLETGMAGVYPMDRTEKMSRELLKKYFRRGSGANAGYCRVVDELRQLITFRQLNLLDKSYGARGPFTAIFCRNVMIYFDKTTQQRVVQQMAPLLADDGLFFAGHSESLNHCGDMLRLAGRTVYRKAKRSK